MPFHRLAPPLAAVAILAALAPALARAADDYSYELKERLNIKDLSVLLYGKEDKWNDIADWNRLKPPYRLEPGIKLKLEDEPIAEQEGRRLIVERWRGKHALSSAYQKPMTAREFLPKFQAQEAAIKSQPAQTQSRHVAWQLIALGKSALAQGDFAGAADFLKRARAVDPANLVAWLTEIRAHRQGKQPAEAKKTADELVQAHPDTVDLAPVREARGRS